MPNYNEITESITQMNPGSHLGKLDDKRTTRYHCCGIGAFAGSKERTIMTSEALIEALTPSAETKAAYSGEFSFPREYYDEEGVRYTTYETVPWTTVKDIMKAILARAKKCGQNNRPI